ncbi:CHAT domain-containing protein [Candidatus Nitrotoga sp. BS]|uniref:CHAT domain-containing protein n=1 Tax=Candidatus Nitrotoga sp. BS TaxID=2890408 RepID=UPI001EF2CEA2|nr:CHAT domain-containing protein [Candidatus Nitrotoga sp. BS]
MAFVSMRSGNADIWIQPLGTSSLALPRQVTTHPASDQEPALNRDGTRLLYVSRQSDPRGDVYLLDLITRKEERLTDLSSGDSFPQWDQEEKGFFYLKRNPLQGTSAIYRKSFSKQSEELIVPQATSFSVNGQGQLLYSNGTQLTLMNLQDKSSTPLGQDGNALDLWPVLDRHPAEPTTNRPHFFARYEQDTNGDGLVDTDDESSIWMKYRDSQSHQFQGLYRITPAHQFHLYPAVSGDFLYYSDLKAGDIFRINIPAFLKDYTNLDQAKTLVASYQDHGQMDMALLVLTNISHNLLAQQPSDARAEFDFSLAEAQTQEGNFLAARQSLEPYTKQSGRIGALARIYTIVLNIQEQAKGVSSSARRRLVSTGASELMAIGQEHRNIEEVYGQALIEAGRLYLFAEDPLTALDYLVKVDDVPNKEIRAKGLFTRGETYRILGDAPNVIRVFVDVIHLFGERSSWGKRAIQKVISLSQQGETIQDRVTALNALISQHRDLPVLIATTRLTIADLYYEQGEQLSALETLGFIVSAQDLPNDLLIQAYRKKATILSGAERYQEAADTYAALSKFTGEDQAELERSKSLLILQLVKKALKDRKVGETRIAAKSLKQLIDQYPESVEAHRAYIETKAMLKETQEVQAWYTNLVKANPDHAVYQYGQALALSYTEPPNLPLVIRLLQRAMEKDPAMGYVHQTLGWAYEQTERTSGNKGYLEKAEQEYRIALEMNDVSRFPEVESQLLLNLGNTYLALSSAREAYRHYRQREVQFAPTGENVTEMLYRKNYGEASFKSRHSEESLVQYQLALRIVPPDQPGLKAEILERIGLSHQDIGQHAKAIEAYAHALDINRELGQEKNVTLLQRNIGVNLFNLSRASKTGGRDELKQALGSYFASLDRLKADGGKTLSKGSGLFNVNVALGGESDSQAASGFDLMGEQKLMFSYIASTYEQLDEAAPARDFYRKKLALLNQQSPAKQDAATMTEKAIVLNHLGVLSHKLHEPDQAIEFFRQSLNVTRALDVPFGTSINIYNLSQLAVENVLQGHTPDQSLVEAITSGIQDLQKRNYENRNLFYTLTNTALLLSLLPEPAPDQHLKPEEAVQRMHEQFASRTLPWSYYQKAELLLQKPDLFSSSERLPALFLVKLNQAELARTADQPQISSRIREYLLKLVEDQQTANSWLWYLAQAENTSDPLTRKQFLEKSVETVLRFPAQTDPRTGQANTGPAYERLTRLSVDQLITDGRPDDAFTVAEQLSIRQMTSVIYEALGEDFFLKGLGSYEPELKSLLEKLRQARSQGDNAAIAEHAAALQDVLYALFEEHPWATASFWAYPQTKELLSLGVDAQRPYLKIVQGMRGYHGFIHNGKTLHYSPLVVTEKGIAGDKEFHQRLGQSASAYLSIPQELESSLSSLAIDKKPLTWVSNFYDFLNGYHQRSLFFSHISTPSGFQASTPSTAGDIPFVLQQFSGVEAHDRLLAAKTNIAAFLKPADAFAFEVQQDKAVREFASVLDFSGNQHHSILLFGGVPSTSPSPRALISSLLRAGFPHVIMSRTTVDPKIAAQFLNQYLSNLNSLPPDKAVVAASKDIWGQDTAKYLFRHYGFAGMDTDERQKYATSIYDQEVADAINAFKTKDFSTSLVHIEHALALIDHAQKRKDFKELNTLAVETAFEIKNYEKGIFFQQKLLNSFTSKTPVNERAEAEYRLGILHSRLEHFDIAVKHIEHANQIWKQGEALDRLAEGIATLGIVRENMGSYTEALEQFNQSFSLYQEIGEMGHTAFQYRRIGRIYYLRLGRYEKARENFLAALKLYQEQKDPKGEAEVLYEVGLTFEKVGLFSQAAERYNQALAIAKRLDDPALLATGDLYLANVAWFQGNYQTAFQLLTQANNIAERANDSQLRIMVENTRGLMYWTLNDTDKGLLHLQDAVTLSRSSNIQTELASSLNNLGLIYRQRGDHVTALDYFQQAKSLDESLKSQWGLGYDHRNIGISLLALGQLEEAEGHFLKAEQISADIHNVINWVKALLELGNVNKALARPQQALGYYERAHELSQRYGIKEVEWRAAAGKATLLQEQGKTSDALTWFTKGVEVVEGMRATLKIDELRNSFQNNKLDLYRDIITLLITMNRTDDAFNFLERSRSRSFIDLLGNQKLSFKKEGDQETWNKINTLASTVNSLKSELGSYEKPPADLEKRYRNTKIRYQEAVLELKQTNPDLSSFVSVDPLNLKGVQQLLAPGVGLLTYFITKDQLYLWLITNERTVFRTISAKEEELTRLVTRYRQLVQHLEPVEDELQKLYASLILPVAPEITKLEYLGIVPDGPLHFLSFAALKHGPAYLVDDIPLFYAPSASVFQFTFAKRQEIKNNKVLAIGNPDLGNFNYDLPLAELEAKSIQWNYPNMDILTGTKATKEWVVKNISRYGIIHLAAHGEFDEGNPLLSSLWLASENPENRQLTVQEIFGLEINADLVTLSACQTGLGKLEAGELIGLNRAFIYAGTHALVSALWRVDDLSTSVLMKHFYRNYVTANKAKSLRQAQLLVKKDFPHPSFWAGFSLIGDYK